MLTNAPKNYICPICLGIDGVENEHTMLKSQDLIYQNDLISVFMNSFFLKGNEGHLIVVPNTHIENIYDMSAEIGCSIMDAAKQMALVMKKVYKCDGITLRQNNEPAGDQHAFHFHLHIVPRYEGDSFNSHLPTDKIKTTINDRLPYIKKLQELLAEK